MANRLKMLTSQLSNVHFTRMFILLVECGLVHRGDCINCETCYFFAFMVLYVHGGEMA